MEVRVYNVGEKLLKIGLLKVVSHFEQFTYTPDVPVSQSWSHYDQSS